MADRLWSYIKDKFKRGKEPELTEFQRKTLEHAQTANEDLNIMAFAKIGDQIFDILPQIVEVVPKNVNIRILLIETPTSLDSQTTDSIKALNSLVKERGRARVGITPYSAINIHSLNPWE